MARLQDVGPRDADEELPSPHAVSALGPYAWYVLGLGARRVRVASTGWWMGSMVVMA